MGYFILKNIKLLSKCICTKAIDGLFSFYLTYLRIFEHNQNHLRKNVNNSVLQKISIQSLTGFSKVVSEAETIVTGTSEVKNCFLLYFTFQM